MKAEEWQVIGWYTVGVGIGLLIIYVRSLLWARRQNKIMKAEREEWNEIMNNYINQ